MVLGIQSLLKCWQEEEKSEAKRKKRELRVIENISSSISFSQLLAACFFL